MSCGSGFCLCGQCGSARWPGHHGGAYSPTFSLWQQCPPNYSDQKSSGNPMFKYVLQILQICPKYDHFSPTPLLSRLWKPPPPHLDYGNSLSCAPLLLYSPLTKVSFQHSSQKDPFKTQDIYCSSAQNLTKAPHLTRASQSFP